jgi:hypothetical protein
MYAPPGTAPPGARLGSPSKSAQPSAPSNLQPGQYSESPQSKGSSQKPVPKYPDAGSPPSSLGSPLTDDDADEIKRPSGGRDTTGTSGASVDTITDESAETLAAFGEEEFARPEPLQTTAGTAQEDGLGRPPASRPSPYKYDREAYKWLRGTVARDAQSNSWRITYSRNPLDDDPYGGSLTLVDDQSLDNLVDGDVVLIEGNVDTRTRDRYGKPSYQPSRVMRLKERSG